MLIDYNGRAIDVRKIKTVEKIKFTHTGKVGLDLYLYNGNLITINYNYNIEERNDRYFSTIKAINYISSRGLQNYN